MELSDLATTPKKEIKNYDVIDYYKSVFNEWDEDGDGSISLGELKKLIAINEDINLTKEALHNLMSRYDYNNDDLIDFDEFLDMLNNPEFRLIFRKVANKYLKFVIIPRCRRTIQLKRTVTTTGIYEKEVKCKKNTVGLILISAVQIILHHVNYAYALDEDGEKREVGPIGCYLRFDPCRKFEIYRYITHIFVHSLQDSHFHLYLNVLLQLLLGVPLEMVHSWRILLIYFIGAIIGAMTHSVINITDGLKGASSAVYSFFTAHIATVLMNWREMRQPVISLLLFTLIIIFDTAYEVVMKFILKMNDNSKVSVASHLGGTFAGFLLGILILRNLNVTSKEIILWKFCLAVFLIFVSLLLVLDIYDTFSTVLPYCENKNRTKRCY